MRQLPDRPNLDQLRRQAKELHRRAIRGEPAAVGRMRGSKRTNLSAAQQAVARDYGFPSWARLKAEVERRRAVGSVGSTRARRSGSSPPARRDWQRMRDMMFSLLIRRTGQDVDAWRRKINRQQFNDQSVLRAWLKEQGVTGYSQMLLVWERFGYPSFMTAGVDDLIDRQYADRPVLRPVLEAVLDALPRVGPSVVVQARKTYISLVSERRTFAVVQATTRHRVDLGLRLKDAKVAGRLERAKGVGNGSMTVKLSLTSPKDLDREALVWLRRAYRENV
jgi:hypothetical protein